MTVAWTWSGLFEMTALLSALLLPEANHFGAQALHMQGKQSVLQMSRFLAMSCDANV